MASNAKIQKLDEKTLEVEECFSKLQQIYPFANDDHLLYHAKKIGGNQDALEDFIVEHLDKEIEAPSEVEDESDNKVMTSQKVVKVGKSKKSIANEAKVQKKEAFDHLCEIMPNINRRKYF